MSKGNLLFVLFVAACATLVLFGAADALASTSSDLPFVEPMTKLKDGLSGPFATAAAVIGIVAAGGTLIFGGDLNGFFRSMIFLVLIVCLLVLSNKFLTFIAPSSGALVAQLV